MMIAVTNNSKICEDQKKMNKMQTLFKVIATPPNKVNGKIPTKEDKRRYQDLMAIGGGIVPKSSNKVRNFLQNKPDARDTESAKECLKILDDANEKQAITEDDKNRLFILGIEALGVMSDLVIDYSLALKDAMQDLQILVDIYTKSRPLKS